MSIAELQRQTKIKRSTLIYYLNILQAENYIIKERIEEKVIGRPTIIKLKKPSNVQETKELNNRKE